MCFILNEAGIAHSKQRLATRLTVRGSNPDGIKNISIRINYQLNANISLFGSTCFGLYAHLQEHVEPNKLIFALSW